MLTFGLIYEKMNRELPGPQIRVCHRDQIVVHLTNLAEGTGTSIHWHGMFQKGTPWADGVALVTQVGAVVNL